LSFYMLSLHDALPISVRRRCFYTANGYLCWIDYGAMFQSVRAKQFASFSSVSLRSAGQTRATCFVRFVAIRLDLACGPVKVGTIDRKSTRLNSSHVSR